MLEKWNEFVYDLCEAKNRNAEESEYHSIIESQMKLLGWLKSKGDICHKANIPIGNNNYIQPDILIRKDGIDQFVIEVKRPVHNLTDRERQQLVSYMRQLKLMVGVYIGEHIEVFYDKPGTQDVESVLAVELFPNNANGEKFVSLFDKNLYDQSVIVDFCEEQQKRLAQDKMLANMREQLLTNGNALIAESLKHYLVGRFESSFPEEKLDDMLSTLRFNVCSAIGDGIIEEQNVRSSEAVPSTNNIQKKSTGHDNTNYILNGSTPLGKNEFVLAVVKEYIKQHPEKTFGELENVFKPQYQLRGNRIDSTKGSDSCGVIRSLRFIEQKGYEDWRYHKETLLSSDKIPFKVCKMWGIGNIGNMVELARRLGYEVRLLQT
jgi:hypothetical protein